MAQLLLANEADVEARDEEGNTPLHVAAQNQQTELVHMLLDGGADADSENQVLVCFARVFFSSCNFILIVLHFETR